MNACWRLTELRENLRDLFLIATMMGGPHQRGLHLVALFESAKGAIVMFVGFGLLSLIHQDVELVAQARCYPTAAPQSR